MPVFYVLALGFFVFGAVVAERLLLSLFALQHGAQPVTVGLIATTFSIFPMLFSVVAGTRVRWLTTCPLDREKSKVRTDTSSNSA